jgi:hypothetical protein
MGIIGIYREAEGDTDVLLLKQLPSEIVRLN